MSFNSPLVIWLMLEILRFPFLPLGSSTPCPPVFSLKLLLTTFSALSENFEFRLRGSAKVKMQSSKTKISSTKRLAGMVVAKRVAKNWVLGRASPPKKRRASMAQNARTAIGAAIRSLQLQKCTCARWPNLASWAGMNSKVTWCTQGAHSTANCHPDNSVIVTKTTYFLKT